MKEAETRFTIEALVIKEMSVGESDRLVTLFTRNDGLIRAFVSGAKQVKSKKGAATSLLTLGSYTLLKKRDTYKIYDAAPIRLFFSAKGELEVLALSQYFCELAAVFAEPTGGGEFFRLILNSLYFLTEKKRYPPLIKALTELRTAGLAGYMPNLVACRGCGKFEDDRMFFDVLNGSLFCPDCKNQSQDLLAINRTILSAMRHIVYADFAKLYAFSVPHDAAKALSELTGRYLTLQSDHRFAALEFYSQITAE